MSKTAEAYRAEGRIEAYKRCRDEIEDFSCKVGAPIEIDSEWETYHSALAKLEVAIAKRERRRMAQQLGLLP